MSKRPFMERIRFDSKTGEFVEDSPLRERFPVYLKILAILVVASGALGLLIALLTDVAPRTAFGYTWVFAGTVLLLVSGVRGGGYSNLSVGAFEAVVGGRNRTDDDYETDAELRQGRSLKRRDPLDRLRRGLRPPPNPTAFWQAIAGFLLIALGLPLTF